mgnify:CR=1 FL=1
MAALLLLITAGVWGYVLWAASGSSAVEERLARYAGRPGALQEVRRLSGSPLSRLVGLLAARRRHRRARGRRQYSVAEMQAAGIDPARLDAMRLVLAAVVGGAVLLLGILLRSPALGVILGTMGAGVGYILPGIRATQRLEARRREILRSLPDTLDLIAVAMNAGLSFDHAVSSISSSRADPLSRLFGTYLEEVSFGRPAGEALVALAERSGVSEVRQVVAHVIQSRRYGASLVDVLRTQADYMRRILRMYQRERAGRASVQMLFPLILCIFPVTFLITIAPMIIRFLSSGLLSGITEGR